MRPPDPSHHSSPAGAPTRALARSLTRALRALVPALALALTVSLATGVSPTDEEGSSAEPVAAAARKIPAWRAPLARGPRVGTFNLLGATHTDGKGGRKGYPRYAARLRKFNKLLRWQRLSVVGLQEFQYPQRKLFFKMTGRRWAVSPNGRQPNEIIWKRSAWRKIRAGRFRVQYLHGQRKSMPYVLLQRTKTRKRAWFVNVHNPAAVRGSPAKHRKAAMRREMRQIRDLRKTGHPVVFLGDFNERRSAFCYVRKRGFRSSAGGSWKASRKFPCRAPRDVRIDWIFGKGGKVRFGGHRVDVRPVRQKASDHPIVITSLPRFRR